MIQKTSLLNYRSYFDLETGNESNQLTETSINGRIQGYGIVIQLYNNSTNKELRGIELPKGDINFDIILSESQTNAGGTLTESEYIPVLWDYKENMYGDIGKLNRNLSWTNNGKDTSLAKTSWSTLNKNHDRAQNSCYDGGNWTIEQTDNYTYHVTIKDYKFDKFNDFFNRVLIDMRNEGLCEEHERKVVKMFIKSFKNSSIVSY